jgi:hypothetical protein
MARIIEPVTEIRKTIEQFAGAEVANQVTAGSETLTDTARPEEIAMWVKGTMERLDQLVNKDTRCRIMSQCGYQCALMNKAEVDKAVARRKKFATLEEYLEAEEHTPQTGVRLMRQGDIVYQYYTPRSWAHPMRCYCSLMRGLPEDQTVSLTYCQCSRGLVERTWELILGRPVQVEILESSISGASECKFAIHL